MKPEDLPQFQSDTLHSSSIQIDMDDLVILDEDEEEALALLSRCYNTFSDLLMHPDLSRFLSLSEQDQLINLTIELQQFTSSIPVE